MRAPGPFSKWSSWAPQLQSLLRIVAAALFILPGTMKLFAFPIGVPPAGGTVPLVSQLGLGAVLEVFGGALILLGLFTRPVAFVLAGEMAVAYFQFHAPKGFWPIVNGGQGAILFCFVWLYFSAAGAGPWSLDAARER
ncbi:MAG TPA: DoxX family protein [Thermoanaerobaculia bacterium]|jgi:putative oxidoreductase